MDPPWLQAACMGKTLKMRLLTLEMGLYTLKNPVSLDVQNSCWATWIYSTFCWFSLVGCYSWDLIQTNTCVRYTVHTPDSPKNSCSTEIMSLKGRTKSWTTNTCHLLLLLHLSHFLPSKYERLAATERQKCLVNRNRNAGESVAHKWGVCCPEYWSRSAIVWEGTSLLLAWLLPLCSLWTDSQGVIWSFPNLLSGSLARLSLWKCHRESFHLCEQTLGLGVAPAEQRWCQCEGAGARGDVSAALSVQGCLPSRCFFLFPRDRYSKNICCKLGFVKILVSFLFPQTCRKTKGCQRGIK